MAKSPQLKLSVHPKHFVLGQKTTCRIKVAVPSTTTSLRLSSNIGTVVSLKRTSATRYTAEYKPPMPTYPRVAIISAVATVDTTLVHAWVSLPLWGQGDAVVKTEPKSAISIQIGNRTFGPIRANNRGLALIPVVVPPGIRVGIAEEREIDLGLPEVSLLFVDPQRVRLSADAEETVLMHALAVTETGHPRTGAVVELTPSRGTCSKASAVSPGHYVAKCTFPEGDAGEITVAGKITGEPKSIFRCQVVTLAGMAANLALTLQPPQIVAGTQEVVALGSVTDKNGNPSDCVAVWQTSLGELLASETLQKGQLQARFGLPNNYAEQRQLTITGYCSDSSSTGSASAKLLAAAPHRILFDQPQYRVDAEQQLRLKVTIEDKFGNRQRQGSVRGKAKVGQATVATERERYVLTYTAPDVLQRTHDTITVEAGTVQASSKVEVLPLFRWLTATPKIGVLSDLQLMTTPYIGAEFTAWMPLWQQDFGLSLEGGYFLIHREYQLSRPPIFAGKTVTANNSYLPVVLSLNWRNYLLGMWPLWAQLGAGPTYVLSQMELPEQPNSDQGTLIPSLHATLGLGRRLWRGSLFVEGRYWWFADPDLQNLRGALVVWMLATGYRIDLL